MKVRERSSFAPVLPLAPTPCRARPKMLGARRARCVVAAPPQRPVLPKSPSRPTMPPATAPRYQVGLNTDDSMEAFARDVAQYPLLTADEEKQLTYRMSRLRVHTDTHASLDGARDDEAVAKELEIDVETLLQERRAGLAARDALVAANLRLVLKIARGVQRTRGPRAPLLDVVQEGVLGLLRATDTFDPTRGVKFATYAYRMVVRRCLRASVPMALAVHVPERVIVASARVRAARASHFARTGEEASDDQVLQMVPGLSLDRVRIAERHLSGTLPLDAPLSSKSTFTVADVVADDETRGPVANVEGRCAAEEVRRAIRTRLKPRDAQIMSLKFGLDGQEPLLSKTIAKLYSISESRIHQIVFASLAKIRECEPQLAAYI